MTKHNEAVHLKLKPFKCDECHKCFSQKFDLTKHVNSVHLKLRPFQCNKCMAWFSYKQKLTIHDQTVHLKSKPFKCKDCKSKFGQKSSLKTHIDSVHLKLKPFKCEKCNIQFSWKKSLTHHDKTVHPNLIPYKCKDCNKSFAEKSDLKAHINNIHLKSNPLHNKTLIQNDQTRNIQVHSPKLAEYKCEHCKRAFICKSHYEKHVILMHNEKKESFKIKSELEYAINTSLKTLCSEYKESFEKTSDLDYPMNSVIQKVEGYKPNDHQKSSLDNDSMKVDVDHKHFREKKSSKKLGNPHHVKIELDDKPPADFLQKLNLKSQVLLKLHHKCKQCKKYFVTKSKLKWHINKKHLKRDKLSCTECEATFLSKRILEQHMKNVHLDMANSIVVINNLKDVKPFKCDSCPKIFASESLLKTHVDQVHSLHLKDYKCGHCKRAFICKSHYNKHVITMHSLNKTSREIVCSECNASFEKESDLEYHMNCDHQKVKGYKCKPCVKSFLTKLMLKEHVNRAH